MVRAKNADVTGYRLLWVMSCPNSDAKQGTPCLVEGTPLAALGLRLAKKLDGDATSATLRIPMSGTGPGGLYEQTRAGALVLGASNRYGNSELAIIESARVGSTPLHAGGALRLPPSPAETAVRLGSR